MMPFVVPLKHLLTRCHKMLGLALASRSLWSSACVFFVYAIAIYVVTFSIRASVQEECLFVVCKNVHLLKYRLM